MSFVTEELSSSAKVLLDVAEAGCSLDASAAVKNVAVVS